MPINVIVPDKTVVIDGEGYFCSTLSVPEGWAHAYHWRDDGTGTIEPDPSLGQDPEHFNDPARMDFARDAHASAKGAAEDEAERLTRAREAGPDPDPEPRPQKRKA